MTFGDVADYAIRYAKNGFPAFELFANYIEDHQCGYERTEENRRIYLPGGRPPKVGELFVQRDLAASLQYMADQEATAGGSRSQGLQAAYDAFYKGDIAVKIAKYHAENGGLLNMEDMADFRVSYEEPVRVRFAGCDVYCCGPWSQGISLAQVFGMLERADLNAMGHNSPDYIHYVTETLKLAFADRERYLADPRFVDVPTREMLDPAYLDSRLQLVFRDKAWPQMPPAGDPTGGANLIASEAPQLAGIAKRGNRRLCKNRLRAATRRPGRPGHLLCLRHRQPEAICSPPPPATLPMMEMWFPAPAFAHPHGAASRWASQGT